MPAEGWSGYNSYFVPGANNNELVIHKDNKLGNQIGSCCSPRHYSLINNGNLSIGNLSIDIHKILKCEITNQIYLVLTFYFQLHASRHKPLI